MLHQKWYLFLYSSVFYTVNHLDTYRYVYYTYMFWWSLFFFDEKKNNNNNNKNSHTVSEYSKETGKRWFSRWKMSEKCVNKAAFSNIQNLFSEAVNTICFAMKHTQSNKINKYLKIYAEVTVLYTIEMLSILQSSFRSSSSLFTENASDVRWFRTVGKRGHCLSFN